MDIEATSADTEAKSADVLGCDGHFDVSPFFELHFVALLIRQ